MDKAMLGVSPEVHLPGVTVWWYWYCVLSCMGTAIDPKIQSGLKGPIGTMWQLMEWYLSNISLKNVPKYIQTIGFMCLINR